MAPLKKVRKSGIAITVSILFVIVLGFLDYLSIIELSVKWYVALTGAVSFFTIDLFCLRNFEENKVKIKEMQRSIYRIETSLSQEDKVHSVNKVKSGIGKIHSIKYNNSVIDTYN